MAKRLTEVRKQGLVDYLRPDGKTQVTVEYDEDGQPGARRHRGRLHPARAEADLEQIRQRYDASMVIKPIIPAEPARRRTPSIFVNPTGRFVIGGPQGDSGLTGRKIIVDTYGGMRAVTAAAAFSGKDPTKVDRSAAYAARWVAKNIVAAGLAVRSARCSWPTPSAWPIPCRVLVETFGTGTVAEDEARGGRREGL